MRLKLFGAAAALLLVMGTAQRSEAQVYFSYGNGFYGNGFSVGVGGVPTFGGVVQSGYYAPGFGGFTYPGYGYGYRSFYGSPAFGGAYTPYYGNRYYGGGRYYGNYGGRRYRR